MNSLFCPGVTRCEEELAARLIDAGRLRDDETGSHAKRVGSCSAELARVLGWSEEAANRMCYAAALHDIGKLGISDGILRKPGPLTPLEFAQMKQHTLIGASLLRGSRSPVLQLAAEIAECHHEWWNGGGYPHGLVGEQIPQSARIVAIIDAFDALTHDRVYRPAFPMADAVSLIRGIGERQFDPDILDAFLSMVRDLSRIADSLPDEREVQLLPLPQQTGRRFSTIDFDALVRSGSEPVWTPAKMGSRANGSPPVETEFAAATSS